MEYALNNVANLSIWRKQAVCELIERAFLPACRVYGSKLRFGRRFDPHRKNFGFKPLSHDVAVCGGGMFFEKFHRKLTSAVRVLVEETVENAVVQGEKVGLSCGCFLIFRLCFHKRTAYVGKFRLFAVKR